MSDNANTNQKEDEVLKRLLKTKPKPKKDEKVQPSPESGEEKQAT